MGDVSFASPIFFIALCGEVVNCFAFPRRCERVTCDSLLGEMLKIADKFR